VSIPEVRLIRRCCAERLKGREDELKLAYLDCFAGASGDMIVAGLIDLGVDLGRLAECVAGLGIGDVGMDVSEVLRKQVRAKAFSVKPPPDAKHRTYRDIVEIIEKSSLVDAVKAKSIEAFDLLAEAEAGIHGLPKMEVHFHEVGGVDSIVDVVGAFFGLEELGIDRVVSSPLVLGSGSVNCEHGTLPVPAPATLRIVEGLPVRSWDVGTELTTPTGAAIIKTAASGFGSIPGMRVLRAGYGAGGRELERIPNIMRIVVGETSSHEFDEVQVIETNIDDMNPQFFSHLYDDLFAAGALDVWVANIMMKKGRPGFLLSVLAGKADVSRLVDIVLSGTTTSGVRLTAADRMKLPRESLDVETRFGQVRVKVFMLDSGPRFVPEYDDCLRVSRAGDVSLDRVMEEARHAGKSKWEATS
jgi:uncharacterized protein (TIGR00299 family) protein